MLRIRAAKDRKRAATQPGGSNEQGGAVKREFLMSVGWREEAVASPYRWFLPALPAAHYTLRDAYELTKRRK
jgi:hypothetical protein